ncbi:MAG: FAD-binding protein, partial [Mesorhizobium sp.]
MADDADVIIVGAGLAGLVAAAELAEAGKKTIVVDQEPEQSLGGQAFWSLGGIFLVDSSEQRRMRIRDSHDLALEDWLGAAAFDGNPELVRKNWPQRLGTPPRRMISGVPDHVDGRMLAITEQAGGSIINRDRMWHYVEGIRNWAPLWTDHAIRMLPGPSSLWLDARGKRLPVPLYPGFDTLGTLRHIM